MSIVVKGRYIDFGPLRASLFMGVVLRLSRSYLCLPEMTRRETN